MGDGTIWLRTQGTSALEVSMAWASQNGPSHASSGVGMLAKNKKPSVATDFPGVARPDSHMKTCVQLESYGFRSAIQ
ncbi:hypothetical protein P7K49_031314 [Saguinus oedipus]|uniref:Uncharacterized protein n=1 Tax=Saguinus oedipus TaxID=9490 RepID=A0ABQ9TZ35_SAGOE|nr:hypothetical protein P7K49_031314 [Saguinus oedipus]